MIYAIHPIIIEVVEKLTLKILGNNTIFALVAYIVAPITTLTLIYAISTILEKYMPSVYQVISGGRKTQVGLKRKLNSDIDIK